MIKIVFPRKIAFFPRTDFQPDFFSLKMIESGKVDLQYCIIDFDEIQV